MLAATLAAVAANAAAAEEPAWKAELREKLQKKVSFDFTDTPLTEAVFFLETLTRVNMVLDPHALRVRGDAAITLEVGDTAVEGALKRVVELARLDYAFLDEAVFISTPEGLAVASKREEFRRLAEARAAGREEPVWEREIRKQLARKVTFCFPDTPLAEALSFFQVLTRITFIVEPEPAAARKIAHLRVSDMSLGHTLRWMLKMVELDYVLKDGAVFISTPEKIDAELTARIEEASWEHELRRALGRRVSFDFVGTPFTEALSFFQTLTRVNMVLDPQALREREKVTVTLKVEDMVLEDALEKVVKLAELRYDLLDEALFISTPERLAETLAREAARRRSDRRGPAWMRCVQERFRSRVSFEFVETPLSEAISFVQTLMKVSMILDPKATGGREEPITLRVQNMSLGSAFRWVLRLVDLDYTLTDQAILVSTHERIDAERKRAEAGEVGTKDQLLQNIALERRVSFDFVETPLGETLAFYERLTGLKMVLSPRALRECGDAPVSLKVSNMSLHLSLDWIVKLAGLEYSIGEDAVHIFAPGERPPP